MQNLGLVAMGLIWLGAGYMLVRWRGTNDMSMSMHAASAREAYVLFGSVLTLSGGLLYWFMLGWFVPHLGLGPGFVAVLTAAIGGMLVAAWVPDTAGWKRRVHRWCAYGMAVLLMPLAALIVADPAVAIGARVVGAVCVTYMLVSLALVTQFGKMKRHYLPLQVAYVVAFEVTVLAATYL